MGKVRSPLKEQKSNCGAKFEKTTVAKIGAKMLLVFSVLILAVTAPKTSEASEIRKCGKELVNLVVRMCNGCVNGGTAKRNSQQHFPVLALQPKLGEGKSGNVFHPFTHQNSDSFLDQLDRPLSTLLDLYKPHGRRIKRQIADECCINKCSYATLKKYCCEP